jgi:hypothetical protein
MAAVFVALIAAGKWHCFVRRTGLFFPHRGRRDDNSGYGNLVMETLLLETQDTETLATVTLATATLPLFLAISNLDFHSDSGLPCPRPGSSP